MTSSRFLFPTSDHTISSQDQRHKNRLKRRSGQILFCAKCCGGGNNSPARRSDIVIRKINTSDSSPLIHQTAHQPSHEFGDNPFTAHQPSLNCTDCKKKATLTIVVRCLKKAISFYSWSAEQHCAALGIAVGSDGTPAPRITAVSFFAPGLSRISRPLVLQTEPLSQVRIKE